MLVKYGSGNRRRDADFADFNEPILLEIQANPNGK
jgi:hypothetical protein